MTQFGAHAFVWEGQWDAGAARRAVNGAAEAGLDFLEIPLLHPEEFDSVGTRALLKEAGLAARCSVALPMEASLPDAPGRAVQFLETTLESVERLGSPMLSGVIYGTLGSTSGQPMTETELDTIAGSLRKVARTARTLGLRIGLEPVNRYETNIVNTTQQALSLIASIDEPNVFLHLDTYHMNIEEKGLRRPFEEAGPRLQYVHLSESDRGTPGTGNVNWDQVFAGLASAGYRGDLAMESFVAVNPDIARATCIWRKLAPDSRQLVAEGLSFLKAKAVQYGLND